MSENYIVNAIIKLKFFHWRLCVFIYTKKHSYYDVIVELHKIILIIWRMKRRALAGMCQCFLFVDKREVDLRSAFKNVTSISW